SVTCGPEPKSQCPQLCAGTFACALPIPSSAATATATVLFRKSLRCIEGISSLAVSDYAGQTHLERELGMRSQISQPLSEHYCLYRFISFVQYEALSDSVER